MSKPFSFGLGGASTPLSGGGGLFGSTQPAVTTTTTNLFGSPAPQQQQQPASTGFGTTGGAFSFNKPATTASPFGQQQQQPTTSLFGAPKPATTFSFGGATTTTATTAPTTQQGGFGGFGATFGSNQPTTTGGGFTGFGSTTQAATTNPAPSSLFGSTTQQQPAQQSSLFSFSNPTATTTTAPSIFGATTFQQQQQQQQQQGMMNQQNATSITDQERLISALVNPHVYNDERDTIISKWNQLQAFYGFGKVFFQNASLEVSKENPFSRFKTVGYSFKPSNRNEDGLVCLIMKQKESVARSNQKSIVDTLHKIFNSDASLSINLESIKPIEEEKTEIVFYVTQKNNNTAQSDQTQQRIPSLTVFAHLNKQEAPAGGLLASMRTTQTIKQQLDSLSIENVFPLVGLSEEQIKSYLEQTPSGVHPVLWEQAKKNNPNTKKLIPVQINGFSDINKRFKLQDKENQSQREQLSQIVESIEAINSRNKLIKSKIEQFKARNEDLEHRVLKVMINYEIRRKLGLPLQENEKYLLSVLESFQMELNSPINKEIQRQKLNEFAEIIKSYELRTRGGMGGNGQLSQEAVLRQSIGACNNTGCVTTKSGEVIDLSNLTQVQKTMRDEQRAIKSLVDIINKDVKDLNVIKSTLFKDK